MKREKRLRASVAIMMLLLLSACAGKGNVPYDLSGAVKVQLREKETGRVVTVTEKTGVQRLVENICSLTVKKLEYSEPTVLAYTMECYDENGERIVRFGVPKGERWLSYGGYDHGIQKGALDVAYWEQLLDEQGMLEGDGLQVQYIRTDGGGDKTAYPYAVLLRSREELEAYYEANRTIYALECRETVCSDTSIGFLDACEGYDEAFFEENDLVFAVLEEGSGSVRHQVSDVRRASENGSWQVMVRFIVPECGTCDMAQWHIMIEVPKGVIGEEEKVSVVYGETEQTVRPAPDSVMLEWR